MLVPVVVFIFLAVLATAQNYCDICSDHTMCVNKGIGRMCGSTYRRGVNSKKRKEILDTHNSLRNKIALGEETRGSNGEQPSASNMKKLKWNKELSAVAQRWADQCNYRHDDCRNTKAFPQVGQNLAISYISSCDRLPRSTDWDSRITSWYDEVTDFDKNIVDKYRSDEKTGHYTQLVWANTSNIGCGYTAFYSTKNGRRTCNQYYVCNYGMAGNVINQQMYEKGSPRASCPRSRRNQKYPGLC